MPTLKVYGERVADLGDSIREGERRDEQNERIINVKRLGAVRLDARRAAGQQAQTIEGVNEDSVIEVRLEGDLKIWTTLGQFRKNFSAQATRGAADDAWEFPTQIQGGPRTRALGTALLKGLEVFDIEPAEGAARKIAELIEGRLWKGGAGLYRCPLTGAFDLLPLPDKFPADKPALIFIHGTASSTEAGYRALWQQDPPTELKALSAKYGDAVFAFEHRTLTESPVKNVCDLLKALRGRLPQDNAKIHVVTHSRGGLVGELLCRSLTAMADGRDPFDKREIDFYAQGGEGAQRREEIEELNALLRETKFEVKRFVRVACPARGTSLASGKLDIWLSAIVNLVGKIPVFKGNPLYELLTDFVLAVAKERTDPATLPGLEAQMPGSALVRILNLPGVRVNADLSVIAGDVEGAGPWGKLKLFLLDRFYGGEHDLIVDTLSMYGGTPRVQGARYFFDQGAEVNHFNYFQNKKTAEKLVAGLTRPEGSDGGFTPLEEAAAEVPARAARGAEGPRPVVFVLPGIMGSHLAVRGNRVWLDPLELAFGGFQKLDIKAEGVEAQKLIAMAYGGLVEYLSHTHEVITFPYDWRKSISEEARRLAQQVEDKLASAERARQPVCIVAHSMGGLVARMMIAQRPDLWDRLCQHPSGRLLMLGTPNGGSHEITRLLVGQSRTLGQLAFFDITRGKQDLLKIISCFPGVLEMLPADDDFAFFSLATWQRLSQAQGEGWVCPEQERLDAAHKARAQLATLPHRERVLYVAGFAPATPAGLEVDNQASEGERLRFTATSRGDGRVLWRTGIPDGVKVWYNADAEHGDLANHEPSFRALLDLLQTGDTARLPTTPPALERGAEETFALPPDVVDVLPDQDDLAAAALGARRRTRRAAPKQRRIKVSIAHGSLGYAKHPVAVGHYEGDSIVGAESYLDYRLNGRLKRRQQLGLYPGGVETCEVFLNPDRDEKPGGAIVVGLGKVGDLSPLELTRSVAKAVLAYALTVAEWPDDRFGKSNEGSRSVTITSLLIGTGAGGLSVTESLNAVLRGVMRADTALRESGQDDSVSIDDVEFVEIWEDRAIQAAHALQRVADDPELREHFECNATVREGTGGRERVLFEEEPGWWQRLQIIGDPDGALRFSALTDRARAEISLLSTQRAFVDKFIEQAVRRPTSDSELARTLFEMLLPNRLKQISPERRNIVLVLNEEAARYPWELLEDRWSDGGQPIAVEAGVLRQLETQTFRERVGITSQRTALVIGDPLTTLFVPLPGAEAEAGLVAAQMGRWGFKVKSCIKEDAVSIGNALHADAYRILHLAGHGVHEHVLDDSEQTCASCQQKIPLEKKKTISGMVIGDKVFLTPGDIEQMRQVPELVFINCCHLGRTDDQKRDTERGDRHKLAANIAAQFIRMGVRAVIAAGWAVDDNAAKTFASKFYELMLDGYPFGRAALMARQETYRLHPSVNTWGAYQCYGDPDYLLEPTRYKSSDAAAEPPFVSPSEAVVALRNQTNRAKVVSVQYIDEVRDEVHRIMQRMDGTWLKRGDILSELGLVYGELGDYERAVNYLREALKGQNEMLSVKAIEQLANFEARWAVQKAQTDTSDSAPTSDELMSSGIERLARLLQMGETAERLALLGSAYKRKALVTTGRQRSKALEEMRIHYEKAHHLVNRDQLEDVYPLRNWLLAELLTRWNTDKCDDAFRDQLEEWLQRASSAASEHERSDPNFWNSVVQPDVTLLRRLVAQDLPERALEIVDGYLDAKRRGASPREFNSVLEHLDFLIEVVKTHAPKKMRNPLGDALRQIRERCEAGV